jgi:superfamily I DNA/RNA helicase
MPGTHDEQLNECRRCPQRIVSMANALIGYNQRLAPKTLNPSPQNAQGDVYIIQHNSIEDEVNTIADYIDWYLQQHPGMPPQILRPVSSSTECSDVPLCPELRPLRSTRRRVARVRIGDFTLFRVCNALSSGFLRAKVMQTYARTIGAPMEWNQTPESIVT